VAYELYPPFYKKHQFDEKGKFDMMHYIMRAYKSILPIKGKERKRTVGGDTKELLSKVKIYIPKNDFVYFLDTTKTIAVSGNIISNVTINYAKLLYHPFDELVQEAIRGEQSVDEYEREIKLVTEGIENLRIRTLDVIKASTLSGEVKEKRITDFENMLIKPVIGFEEALQPVLFFNQIIWQTRHRLNGFGRMDKYLEDFYKTDIASGILTRDIADSLLDDFLEKLSMYSSYKSDALEGDIGQIIILGGLDPSGVYFFNDLTERFLLTQARSKRPDPKTFLRVSEKMPKSLMEIAVECLKAKTGSLLFSNDDVVIPALLEFEIPEEDAYNYCISACWEPFIVGKSFDQNNLAVFDYLVSFDELKWAKDPFVSLLTENCNKTRRDISEGGARYSNYGITTVGLANVIDSLFNIKYLVYEKKKYKLQQMAEARESDFSNDEELYTWCQRQKHYGPDNKDVICLVNRITENLAEVAEGYHNKYGGMVKFGHGSPVYNMLSKKLRGIFPAEKQECLTIPIYHVPMQATQRLRTLQGSLSTAGTDLMVRMVRFWV